jgi:hypothetical protein
MIMRKLFGFFSILLTIGLLSLFQFPQEDYIKISTTVEPSNIKQGNEGVLKIKITPKQGYKISTHPEFMIKLDENNNLSFSKLFFKASELDFETKQENGAVLLELEKEVDIRFKVKEDALLGKHQIRGEVVFTAVSNDSWALKTYKKFAVDFVSSRNRKLKTKKRK